MTYEPLGVCTGSFIHKSHKQIGLQIICVGLLRSITSILEMPKYVAYQKNVAYSFIKLGAKFHIFNILVCLDVILTGQ